MLREELSRAHNIGFTAHKGAKIKLKGFVCLFMSYMFSYNVGVVAFIEVRSNTENRFDGISKQVEMLGATVSKSDHIDSVISCLWISGSNKFSHFIFISFCDSLCVTVK